jgi:hypothetical protein
VSPQHEAHQLDDLIERGSELYTTARNAREHARQAQARVANGSARRARLVAVEEPAPARATAAREVNARISEVAETLTAEGDEATYTFFCECGCLEPVPLTLAGYADAAGALREGHALDD